VAVGSVDWATCCGAPKSQAANSIANKSPYNKVNFSLLFAIQDRLARNGLLRKNQIGNRKSIKRRLTAKVNSSPKFGKE
jgi:hypothetical protein